MNCYLCGKDELQVVRTKVRHNIKRDVLECQNCGLNYLKPIEENLKNYYSENYRKKYSCVVGESVECREIFDILLPFQQERIDELKDILHDDMIVLDVGCSTGHFLHALKKYVKECVGIEYNIAEADFTNKELGFKTYNRSIEETDIPENYFNLITIYQVLEHVSDPINFLKTYSKYLKSDGYICIEVPNVQDILITGYQIEPYKDFWFREPHLYNFSPKTLEMVMEKAGFKGKIKGYQCYNLLNHMNWKFLGEPQKSVDLGWSKPVLLEHKMFDKEIHQALNDWFIRVDEEYKSLLEKYYLSESILFIGQKVQ